MTLVELVIDESEEFSGIEAISVVRDPAIESDFIALKDNLIELAEVNKDKRILMGAALIPNKPIYRKNDKEEFYIFFSKETIEKASQLFFKRGRQNNSSLEHEKELQGLTVVESWIVDDEEKDKSRKYGLNVPLGTWMVSMKVENDDIWNNYVKTGKVKGFSIEGYFANKADKKNEDEEILKKLIDILQ